MTSRVYLLRRVSLVCDTTAAGTLKIYTDLPGEALALRHTAVIDTSNTTKRRHVDIRLPGTIRGRLVQLAVETSGTLRLFGGAMEVKALAGGDWAWRAIPGLARELPDWVEQKLPIEAPVAGWQERALPIRETAEVASWVEVPVDA